MPRPKTIWTDWAREQRQVRKRTVEILYHGHTTGSKHRANTTAYLDTIETLEKFAQDNLELKKANDALSGMLKDVGFFNFAVSEEWKLALGGYMFSQDELVRMTRWLVENYGHTYLEQNADEGDDNK